MGLFSGGIGTSNSESPGGPVGKFSASGELGSIGTFLVCIDLYCSRAATYLTTVNRISTIDYGSGITGPQELFRNRHVLRPEWNLRTWWAYDWPFIPAAIRYKWAGGGFGWLNIGTLNYPLNYLRGPGSRNSATGSWYADPFAKPEDWATYDSTSLPPLTRSTVVADRYAPTENLIQPGPLFLIAKLGEGQSIEFETKVFLEDPFKISATTPTLIDTILGDLFPSSSETEIAFPGETSPGLRDGSEMKAWMLKIG